MPVSENELRDLLRERSASVPTTPELAHRVQDRVRRRRRLEAGAGIVSLVLVLVAAGLVVIPRREAASPASQVPTHRTTQVLGGTLVVTTEGPTEISGEQPFDVRLEIANTGSSTWSGRAAVGVVTGGTVPGVVGENPLVGPVDGLDQGAEGPAATQGPAGIADPSNASQWYGLAVPSLSLAPGQDRTWTFRMKRYAGATVMTPVLGWLPWVDPGGAVAHVVYGDPAKAASIAVTPTPSNRACDTVTVTSATVGPPGPWRVTDASRAVVGPDLAATWVPLEVPDAPGTTVDATGDARGSTVMAAISAYLNDSQTPIPATGYGSDGDVPRPTEQVPGTYVHFSGVRLADVAFTATCGPSGEQITGTWSAFYRRTSGELDCSVVPPTDSLAAAARRFCQP